MSKKAQVWVSTVLYILIIVTVLVIVLGAALPIIKNISHKSSYIRSKEIMLQLDKIIQEVADQGAGSQRNFPLKLTAGTITIANSKVIYTQKTDQAIIYPRAAIEIGNVKIQSDADVNTYQTENYIILNNSRISVNFTRCGNESNYVSVNTANIINSITYEGNSISNFQFLLNDDGTTGTGNGYIKLLDDGSSLSFARVKAHINSSIEYDLIFTLQSNADFLQVNVER
ncbi:hypothetical protein DRJ17_04860 [Candidatus Woesearchaeota archaeon]|nr:MAG: hypothetical protein DRJ17_04860 [Candidatus Woesearchaeota archaeon]